MLRLFWCLLLVLVSVNSAQGSQLQVITDYQPVFIPFYNKAGNLNIGLRKFYQNNQVWLLAVNPQTLQTQVYLAASISFRRQKISNKRLPGYITAREVNNTVYRKALARYTAAPYKLQNAGVVYAEKPVSGNFISIDLCPSVKTFEKQFFQSLVAMADQVKHPIPINLEISGLWLLTHEQEFAWLTQQQLRGKLAITWVNHSFSHLYYPDLNLKQNFVLSQPTFFKQEVLATEKLLLEHGQLPSVFFRFPGLVSDKKAMLRLRKLGLIPIGAQAWLAKGERPKPGGIILVHGNSNEHKGIVLLEPLLAELQPLPLAQAFAN